MLEVYVDERLAELGLRRPIQQIEPAAVEVLAGVRRRADEEIEELGDAAIGCAWEAVISRDEEVAEPCEGIKLIGREGSANALGGIGGRDNGRNGSFRVHLRLLRGLGSGTSGNGWKSNDGLKQRSAFHKLKKLS